MPAILRGHYGLLRLTGGSLTAFEFCIKFAKTSIIYYYFRCISLKTEDPTEFVMVAAAATSSLKMVTLTHSVQVCSTVASLTLEPLSENPARN